MQASGRPLQKSIKQLNYNVITAENGEEALKVLSEENDISLVFTDLVMPGSLSGHDLAKYVLEKYPSIAVLMTSGYAGDLLGEDDPKAIGLKLLRKPYRQAEIAVAFRDALSAER